MNPFLAPYASTSIVQLSMLYSFKPRTIRTIGYILFVLVGSFVVTSCDSSPIAEYEYSITREDWFQLSKSIESDIKDSPGWWREKYSSVISKGIIELYEKGSDDVLINFENRMYFQNENDEDTEFFIVACISNDIVFRKAGEFIQQIWESELESLTDSERTMVFSMQQADHETNSKRLLTESDLGRPEYGAAIIYLNTVKDLGESGEWLLEQINQYELDYSAWEVERKKRVTVKRVIQKYDNLISRLEISRNAIQSLEAESIELGKKYQRIDGVIVEVFSKNSFSETYECIFRYYNDRFLLTCNSTRFSTRGNFSLPVRYKGDISVQVKGGFQQQWPTYVEISEEKYNTARQRWIQISEEVSNLETTIIELKNEIAKYKSENRSILSESG